MTATIMLKGMAITLHGSNVGEVYGFPGDKSDSRPRYKHFISVSVGGKRTSFNYYTSIADYEAGKTEMYPDELKTAFYNFLSDAQLGLNTFEEFCSELGYDEDSRSAEKIWKACRMSAKKITTLGLGDVHDLINEFSENYPDHI